LTLLSACKKDTVPENQPADQSTPAAPVAAAPAAPTAPAPALLPEAAPAPPATPAASAPAATPSGAVRYDAQPVGSKATIEGTSSIHDWHMDSAVIGGFMEVDAKFPESALTDAAAARPKVEVFMPVRSFKSYAKRMDEVMQEQMNEPKHKRIEYKLTELKAKSAAGATGALQFDAVGVLTINGVSKTNTMPVTIEKKDGKLKVIGSTPLKMSDFKVVPPKLTIPLLGSITTGDDIKVSFEWLTASKTQ
jgi:polyisoprenoid-binding protein YceI